MKLAILTLNKKNNYGNSLQAFATQKIFQQYECEVEHIVIREDQSFQKKIVNILSIDGFKNYLMYKFVNKIEIIYTEDNKFSQFNSKYVRTNNWNLDDLKRNIDYYDYYLVGSDQVWNPNFMSDNHLLLDFAPIYKKIGFSASFGVIKLPQKKYKVFNKYLKQFKKISVREESGKKIINSNFNLDCDVLLDPTLLIDNEVWNQFVDKSELKINNNYILTYILDKGNLRVFEQVKSLAKRKNIEIINIIDMHGNYLSGIGPIEFASLIRGAGWIVTDSYHASIFSIVFRRNFCVVKREGIYEGMNDRIDNLFNKLELQQSYFMGDLPISKYNEEKLSVILQNERLKADKFIKGALYD